MSDSILNEAQSLSVQTKYRYTVLYEEAPEKANCLTAIRYLFEKGINRPFPYTWIGDMPRELMTQYGCILKRVKVDSMQAGDVVFLRRNETNVTHFSSRYITHIMIAMDSSRVFHCSEKRGGGAIEDFAKPIDAYARSLIKRVVDEPFLFLRYIDPRNEVLRERYGSELIPFPIPRPLPKSEDSSLDTYRTHPLNDSAWS